MYFHRNYMDGSFSFQGARGAQGGYAKRRWKRRFAYMYGLLPLEHL